MYSKEEFLTISEEYNNEKKALEAEYKKKISACVWMMALSGILMFVFMCAMIFAPVLGVLALVLLVTMIVSAVRWQLNDNKRKKSLEDLADTHYRKYINDCNNK